MNPVLEGARVRRPGSLGRARTPSARTPRQPSVENLRTHGVLLSRPDWNRHAINVYRRAEGSPATWHPPCMNARPRGSPGKTGPLRASSIRNAHRRSAFPYMTHSGAKHCSFFEFFGAGCGVADRERLPWKKPAGRHVWKVCRSYHEVRHLAAPRPARVARPIATRATLASPGGLRDNDGSA